MSDLSYYQRGSVTVLHRLFSYFKTTNLYCRSICLVLVILNLVFVTWSFAANVDNDQVDVFFKRLENSFLERDFSQVVEHLHKDFTYLMTYSTDGNFTYRESNIYKYRESVGAFFISKPEISEYSIHVDDIKRSGNDIMVLIRIKSVVKMHDTVNSCDASSNYHLQYISNRLYIKDIRGNADCTNTKVN